jgi:DnaJ-class molecular chaperone
MGIENFPERKENPTCPRCKGTGVVKNSKGEDVACPGCGGKGKLS